MIAVNKILVVTGTAVPGVGGAGVAVTRRELGDNISRRTLGYVLHSKFSRREIRFFAIH